jgi:hypothetical protein
VLESANRVEQVGKQQQVDDESGVVLGRDGLLAQDLGEGEGAVEASWLVVTVRTTSTSGISGTGLKKCSPTNRSARLVAAAMAAMVRLEVLEAKMVWLGHIPSSSFHSPFLISRSSVTASMTMSQLRSEDISVVKSSRLR